MKPHKCSRFCELTMMYYPDTYLEHHKFNAAMAIDDSVCSKPITHKALKDRARKLRIRGFNRLTKKELSITIQAKETGDDWNVELFELVARERSEKYFSTARFAR